MKAAGALLPTHEARFEHRGGSLHSDAQTCDKWLPRHLLRWIAQMREYLSSFAGGCSQKMCQFDVGNGTREVIEGHWYWFDEELLLREWETASIRGQCLDLLPACALEQLHILMSCTEPDLNERANVTLSWSRQIPGVENSGTIGIVSSVSTKCDINPPNRGFRSRGWKRVGKGSSDLTSKVSIRTW